MNEMSFACKYGITCEIQPTPRQAEFLQRSFGCVRKVYNLLVEEGNKRDAAAAEWHAENPEERAGQAYPYTWITEAEYKEEYPYLKEADAHALQQARTHHRDLWWRPQPVGRTASRAVWSYRAKVSIGGGTPQVIIAHLSEQQASWQKNPDLVVDFEDSIIKSL